MVSIDVRPPEYQRIRLADGLQKFTAALAGREARPIETSGRELRMLSSWISMSADDYVDGSVTGEAWTLRHRTLASCLRAVAISHLATEAFGLKLGEW